MKIIACGAGGNKAAQGLIYHHVLPNLDNILMMNSTERDFPKEAAKNCVLIQNIGGCGKEREIGKEIMVNYLNDPVARGKLDEFLGEDTHLVLIGSMGGGTGSGGLNVLAKYARDLLEMDVTLIAFKGFLEDTREMKNTIDFLKEVPDNIAIQIIDNSSFLNECGGNKVRAEFAANFEFARRISFMMGTPLVPSQQNIDANDLYKIITTPGYQTIEYCKFEDVKNKNQLNEVIQHMIDNSHSLPTEPGCTSIGVMLNVKDKTLNSFDFAYSIIDQAYSSEITPEKFPHIQYCSETGDEKEWMALIVSGLKLPMNELQKLYTQYLRALEKLEAESKDQFFDTVKKLNTDRSPRRFGNGIRKARKQSSSISDIGDFLTSVRTGEVKASNGTFKANEKF